MSRMCIKTSTVCLTQARTKVDIMQPFEISIKKLKVLEEFSRILPL